MTSIDRTPADFDSRNAAHTKRVARSFSPVQATAPGAKAHRSALRRGLGPAIGLAVSAGLVVSGPALASDADEAPAASSGQQSAQQMPDSQQQTAADHTFSSPIPAHSGKITSEFNDPNRAVAHLGTDFAVGVGTPVSSVSGGKVLKTSNDGALNHHSGKGVVIDHGEINGDRMYSYYGHLDEIDVKEGDVVEAGTRIGKSGNTGDSTGPHLHFGVFMNAEDPNGAIWNADSGVGFIDPVDWLDRKGVDAGQDEPVEP